MLEYIDTVPDDDYVLFVGESRAVPCSVACVGNVECVDSVACACSAVQCSVDSVALTVQRCVGSVALTVAGVPHECQRTMLSEDYAIRGLCYQRTMLC